jgi:hypothetical protein
MQHTNFEGGEDSPPWPYVEKTGERYPRNARAGGINLNLLNPGMFIYMYTDFMGDPSFMEGWSSMFLLCILWTRAIMPIKHCSLFHRSNFRR